MSKLLKDLYDENYINLLSNNLFLHYKKFNKDSFKSSIFDTHWRDKELKQRMRHISCTLYSFLPKEYTQSISILKNVFTSMNSQYALENMIFQDFVEVYGLENVRDFETSMDALACFTINSSSEFAIRAFILKCPDKTISKMNMWAKDKNEHLRRLASEGCRPRLPWSIALTSFKKDPTEILNILEILKDDSSLYVRRSVANNLNDISKDNPQILKEISKKWIGKNKNRDWILKHGCRTLLKNSDIEILELFGFKKKDNILLSDFIVPKNILMGEKLEFSFLLSSNKNLGKLRIEYALEFVRQNNKSSRKVFKISEADYTQQTKVFTKAYSFKTISTRKYYAGKHTLSIILNGYIINTKEFVLE